MNKEVGFGYGCLCEPLEEQAKKQGFTLGEKADYFERKKKAVIELMFADILTDTQVDKAFQKLNKQLVKSLIPLLSEEVSDASDKN